MKSFIQVFRVQLVHLRVITPSPLSNLSLKSHRLLSLITGALFNLNGKLFTVGTVYQSIYMKLVHMFLILDP